ncbi:gamma-tubulin-complex subunit SPC97 ASCRUDRAFT_9063 [Ascoidea rubescens DSM 1968]|uniref:Spindle pole body component n=1 Tax=Ascoidea rubescens DSM 1968 TaxID=1344418 RepID=A0A1D2VDR5_9ASCO|nr:hypothetical protein ASCRUDRAFT_9063 [Ascoidea rubescens DSM 1968]ODV59848.1 hypothetical protein ASCRUDRAFT_9063 [Ascoidea rubescens DSM 1968]
MNINRPIGNSNRNSIANSSFSGNEADTVYLLNTDQRPYMLSKAVNDQPLIKDYMKVLPYPLVDLSNSLKSQESLIVYDLLFVLIGLEGNYIRYSNKFNSQDIDSLINGPDYKFAKNLNPSLKDFIKKIYNFGKFYNSLLNFQVLYNTKNNGKIIQVFIHFLRHFLKIDYLDFLINSIENNFTSNSNFNLIQLLKEIQLSKLDFKLNLLYEIIHLIHNDNLKRQHMIETLQTLDVLNNNTINNGHSALNLDTLNIDINFDNSKFHRCKGGIVLNIISKKIDSYFGNHECLIFLNNLFDYLSFPYLLILNNWLINGEIDDPFAEFFIKNYKTNTYNDNEQENTESDNNISNLNLFDVERYWNSKFSIKNDGIPNELADPLIKRRILLTGTYLNALKDCDLQFTAIDFSFYNYENQSLDFGHNYFNNYGHNLDTEANNQDFLKKLSLSINPNIICNLHNKNSLNLKINYWFRRANDLILSLMFDGYDLLNLLVSLVDFFLMANSFDFNTFINSNLSLLKKNKNLVNLNELENSFRLCFFDRAFKNNNTNYNKDNQNANANANANANENENENLHETKNLVLNLVELTIESKNIFDELQDILNVKPLDPNNMNTNSIQALKNLVVESLEHDKRSLDEKPLENMFENFLINFINFQLTLPFPINLMIDQINITKYQLIFRFLLLNRFAINLLEDNYKLSKNYLKKSSISLSLLKKISKLQIMNFNVINYLKNLYFNYTFIIKYNFESKIGKLYKFYYTYLSKHGFNSTSMFNTNSTNDNNGVNNLENNFKETSNIDVDVDYNFADLLTFEGSKKLIQDFIDNILLYLSLTNPNYLKLIKRFFKIIFSFAKFHKKIILIIDANTQDALNNIDYMTAEKLKNSDYIKRFTEYYKKFHKEYMHYEKKISEYWVDE